MTGFHVPNGDHVALASTLARLLQDDVLRRQLGQQAWGWAQNYSWAKVGDPGGRASAGAGAAGRDGCCIIVEC